MKKYKNVDEAIFEIEMVLEDIFIEIETLKEIYIALLKEDKKEYKIIKGAVYKLLTQIEIFFIKLENLILNGGEGEVYLLLEANEKIELLKEKMNCSNSKDRGFLKGFLMGIGIGWLFWSE